MVFRRKQRVILLALLCICGAAVMICGVWSTAFPRSLAESRQTFNEAPHLVWGDDGTAILSASEIWTAGARSLTSTDDSSAQSASTQGAEPQTPEDEGELQSSLPQLYHLPQIFALNYDEMVKNLRVYIYPNSQTGSKNDSYDANSPLLDRPFSEESTTTGFFRLLAKSEGHKFLTSDPDHAHLFFLPVSIDALHGALGPDGVGNHLRQYIQDIRDSYTFWDRSLGADHFYLASYGYKTANHRNNLELTKNAIQVACSPLQPNQAFYPHKDVVLPHYHPSYSPSTSRSTLAYINIDLAHSPLLPQEWKSDSDFVVESSDQSPASSAFASSKFCISLSMRNVVDALRHGCVPVVVSDSVTYDLPFQDVLNWREFSVVIGTEEMADVSSVLTSMSAEKYAKMQYLGLQASKHMEWNDPPAAYDAFHMTMFELWMRRHSVRYARRSETS